MIDVETLWLDDKICGIMVIFIDNSSSGCSLTGLCIESSPIRRRYDKVWD